MADEPATSERATVAAGYDTLVTRFAEWSSSVADPARDELVDDLVGRLPAGSRILDLGCGSASGWAGELGARFALTGVDISAGQIDAARRTVPTGTFLVGDMSRVEFEPASFDAATALYSIGHLPAVEHDAVIARLARWLRPGGLLLASLPAEASPGWRGPWIGGVEMFFASLGSARYEEILRSQGWDIIRAEERLADEPDGAVPFLWVLAHAPAPGL